MEVSVDMPLSVAFQPHVQTHHGIQETLSAKIASERETKKRRKRVKGGQPSQKRGWLFGAFILKFRSQGTAHHGFGYIIITPMRV